MTKNDLKNWALENWSKLLVIVLVIVCIILLMSQCSTSRKNDNLKNNIKSLTDSVQVLELKNGDLVYAKQTLILEKNELEEYLGISKKERKELEKKLDASLALISQLSGQVRIDTLLMKDSIYISEDTVKVYFKYDDRWVALNGNTVVVDSTASTTINEIQMDVPLTMGLTDDYKVFVESGNPYIKFTDINSAAIEGSVVKKKKTYWNVGAQVGIGAQYGLIHKQLDLGPYVGVGIAFGWDF